MGSELCSLKNSDNEVQKQETQIDVIYVMLLEKVSLIGFSQTPPPPSLSLTAAPERQVCGTCTPVSEREGEKANLNSIKGCKLCYTVLVKQLG